MSRLSAERLGEAYQSTRYWDVLTELTAIESRMAGHKGEQTACEIIKRNFEDAGLDHIQVQEFEVPCWQRGSSFINFTEPRTRTFYGEHDVIALPGSPSGTISANITNLNHGNPRDFEKNNVTGEIVMVSNTIDDSTSRWIHRQEKYANAIESGAVGFLFRNDDQGGLPPTGFIEFAESEAPIIGLGVSAEMGERIQRYGDDTAVTVSVECKKSQTNSYNVEGQVGPMSDSEIVIGAHFDCHDISDGAGDNGCGSALLTEIGRLLKSNEHKLDTRIRLVGFGAEEAGMLGSEHWCQTHELDTIKCMLNLDAIGDNRDICVYHEGFQTLRGAFDEMGDDFGISIETDPAIHPHGDQWPFVKRGINAGMIGSGGAGRISNAHTHIDTVDKIDPRDLRDLSIAITEALLLLASADYEIPEATKDDVKRYIDGETVASLRYQDRYPWDGS